MLKTFYIFRLEIVAREYLFFHNLPQEIDYVFIWAHDYDLFTI